MKRLALIVALAFAFALLAGRAGAEPVPSLDSKEWAQGRYSSMHMLLRKTLLKVQVLTVDVRVGKAVHGRFVELIGNKPYSDELGKRLAGVAIDADDALVQVRYLRKVSFKQWLEGVAENFDRAEAAGLITPELRRRIEARLPVLFAALTERGFERGDRLLYRVGSSSLRSVVVDEKGKILVDQTDSGRGSGRVVMASYFAPNNDFREPLLRSLFD
jgi:hypothetical protein